MLHRLLGISPTEPPTEIFTQEPLLNLPDARWGYMGSNVNHAGQLRPEYVFNHNQLAQWLSSRGRHPINGNRRRTTRAMHVPAAVIAAYRQSVQPVRRARNNPIPAPVRRATRNSPVHHSSSNDSNMRRAIAASLANDATSIRNNNLNLALARSLQDQARSRSRSRSRSPISILRQHGFWP